jgi:TatD DNase family protein
MIDTHLHLNRAEFDADREAVLARATAAGVVGFLNVGFDLASSRQSLALAVSDPRILATVGVHPHDAAVLADAAGQPSVAGRRILAELGDLAAHERVVAWGEIGLDFYRDLSPRPAQRAAFRAQLELAAVVDLPVVLHIRDAYPETLALLDEVGVPPRGAILHSFAGEAEHAAWARERGCLLGIGGPVTYRGSRLPAVLAAAGVTADDVLLETDAPWLPPAPWRGKRNEPAYLVHTCDALAPLLGVAPAELAARTTANFGRLCGRLPGALDAPVQGPVE